MSRLQTLLADLPRLALPHGSLTEFTLFPKLPIELRREIWKHVSFEPRIIKLFDFRGCFSTRRVGGQSKIPPLLHASKEARSVGLRHYKLCWERSPFGGKSNKSTMYLNFDVDRFRHPFNGVFPFRRATHYNFDAEDLKNIKFLEFEHDHFDITMPSSIGISAGISYVAQLEELTFVFHNWLEYKPRPTNHSEGFCPIGWDLFRQTIRADTLQHIRNDLEGWNKLSCAIKFKFMVFRDDLDVVPCQADQKPKSHFDTMSLGYESWWWDQGSTWGDKGWG